MKKNPFIDDTSISRSLMMSMDISNSLDLLEFRKAIEIEIAHLAAKRMQSHDIQILERSLVDMKVCIKMESSIIVPDLVFHETLARSTNNEVIIQVYNYISEFFKRIRIEMAVYDDVENALYYHRQILNAIKKGEADKCSRLMRAHIEDVQQHYHGMLYTSDLIYRQILVVRGKKRRKGGGRERSEKDTSAFFLPGRRAYPPSSFSISPTSNHATMSKY
ncbi:FadR/GntR family transcriptional regulator [Aneurinibacillus migulanus]|uniref:FadR/GntR family transcriptional regulator n=1 Tax=Aneurinibacillus migulanus TaxID=47500 RepID=UPI00209F27CD|nr:FCD domain-containing protein [Aneurinibacillus migulanus]